MKTKEQKNSILTYKGYCGSIEFSLEDNCLFGSLIGLENGAMTYEGNTLSELKERFEETVDIYLEHCHECGIKLSVGRPYPYECIPLKK
jgi:predicted HicB family RNase H-like nuclease